MPLRSSRSIAAPVTHVFRLAHAVQRFHLAQNLGGRRGRHLIARRKQLTAEEENADDDGAGNAHAPFFAGHYMLSNGRTPISSRPLRSSWRTAKVSSSRAARSFASS